MIEKMEFLTITGPKNDFDRVVTTYLSKYEIHLENALMELKSVRGLKPFVEVNPYKASLSKAEKLLGICEEPKEQTEDIKLTPGEALGVLESCDRLWSDIEAEIKQLKGEQNRLSEVIASIEPFRMLDIDLEMLINYRFIKFRFGRISHEHYNNFSKHVYDSLDTVFVETDTDKEYVWGVYFVPDNLAVKVDAVFSSLHFERVILPGGYNGTIPEIYAQLTGELKEIRGRLSELRNTAREKINKLSGKLYASRDLLEKLNAGFDVRKLAACTRDKEEIFYILCGWMSVSDSEAFKAEIENDSDIYCYYEKDNEVGLTPPTKLKNHRIFKPFEMFIDMYGLPAYNELDPTVFVAITYTLIFGIMFGDVGQGFCLSVIGFLLYLKKGMRLGGIIGFAGIWSVVFGFMYGSIFGIETLIPALWRRPLEDIMSTLITAIVFGVVLILIAMIITIINAIKAKDFGRLFFDSSGIAGLALYGSVIAAAALMLSGYNLLPVLIPIVIVALLLIYLKEPLANMIEKKSKLIPSDSKAMFFVEAFVELFDVILSYATNTISFVRIGAFALAHAGMMSVVLSLAGAHSGEPNIAVLVIGNILVTGIEGLAVGIQVLRLEYYEMFSRFYKGSGRRFTPVKF